MQLSDEEEIRSKASAVIFDWLAERSPPFTGESKADFVDALKAASVVLDESRDVLQQSVASGRSAGMTWNEIGTLLGTSKQAAQQRFGCR